MASEKQIKQDRAHMAENYSNNSADNICVTCPPGKQKVIYLTFDDGPEPGTVEIFQALKAKGIPATFFFVGENVLACENGTFETLFPKAGLIPGLFKQIFDDPLFQIASHSQTQSHQFYLNYYKTGLKIDRKTLKPAANAIPANTGRRSVLVDFELANLAFSYALQNKVKDKTAQYTVDMQKLNEQNEFGYRGDDVKALFSKAGVRPYVRFLTARLPGTGRWRLPWNNASEIDRKADRDDEADDLYNNGYYIYGWDLEWKFAEGDSSMSADVLTEHNKGKDGWWDYFSEDNISKDRPKQSVDAMFSDTQKHLDSIWDKTWLKSDDDSKAVILMHDRLYRSDADTSATAEKPNQYIKQLIAFIDKCQQQGYLFDVLENY